MRSKTPFAVPRGKRTDIVRWSESQRLGKPHARLPSELPSAQRTWGRAASSEMQRASLCVMAWRGSTSGSCGAAQRDGGAA